MGLRHCNLSSNDLEIVFKRLSREKLDLQNNDKFDQKKDPLIAAQTMKCTKHTVASLGQGDEEVRMERLRTPYIVPWHPWPGRCASARTRQFYPR
jgi:hypothetical protein